MSKTVLTSNRHCISYALAFVNGQLEGVCVCATQGRPRRPASLMAWVGNVSVIPEHGTNRTSWGLPTSEAYHHIHLRRLGDSPGGKIPMGPLCRQRRAALKWCLVWLRRIPFMITSTCAQYRADFVPIISRCHRPSPLAEIPAVHRVHLCDNPAFPFHLLVAAPPVCGLHEGGISSAPSITDFHIQYHLSVFSYRNNIDRK